MAARRNYTVSTQKRGLNLRSAPSIESSVMKLLDNGQKVTIDPAADTPDGWVAVKGGGYVMREFLV